MHMKPKRILQGFFEASYGAFLPASSSNRININLLNPLN